MSELDLRTYIREVQDFPTPGVGFKDITPLLSHPEAFRATIDRLEDHFAGRGINLIAAAEARGFIFGAPLAMQLGIGFIPIRKPGKLPAETVKIKYDLEYGSDSLEMHRDAIQPGQRVVIVDDLLATGGTMQATIQLVQQLGGEIAGLAVAIELDFLKGRAKFPNYDVFSLLHYDE